MNKKFKVDFIGVGAQRCGTTWISKCLSEHPEICFSSQKETHFFNKPKTNIKEYKSFFKHCKNGKIKGEYTPGYTRPEYSPEKVAKKIKKYFPRTKIILCLRNPVDRAYSQFFLEKSRGSEKSNSFERAVFTKKPNQYIEAGFYCKLIKEYFKLFSRKNILVLIYEDIEKDPLRFVQNIYRFLGVDEKFIPPSHKQKLSLPPKIYNFFLIKLIKKVLKPFRNKISLKKFQMPLSRFRDKRKKMNGKTRNKLKEIYKKDIKDLEKLVKKDLSQWR